MLLKGEGFSNCDRGKTTWTVDYFKINRGCFLVVSHSTVYSTTPYLVTPMQINARKTNKGEEKVRQSLIKQKNQSAQKPSTLLFSVRLQHFCPEN